ncbi:MAG: pentapeptide repeat-containing protein [Mesorhizobium sp.]|nr:pentapeptide repeat-containing protein [Mesorhizobium sp.]
MNLTRASEPLKVLDRNLAGSVFSDVNLAGGVYTDANMSGAVFDDVNLTGVRFHNVKLQDASIEESCIAGLRVDGILVTELLETYRAAKNAGGGTP